VVEALIAAGAKPDVPDAAGNTAIDEAVPYQFDADADYNASSNASGDLVVLVKGSTSASTTRYYQVYFDTTGSFSAPTNFTVGSNPRFIAIADFNGDTKPDLAVANTFANSVSILIGTGTGTFGAATNLTLGGSSSPWYIVLGDYNGDGILDLATANGGANNVAILLGVGNGSFSAPVNIAAGSFPVSVAAGDFNGDGKLDLAAGNNGSANVSVLLNNSPTCAAAVPANDNIQNAQAIVGATDKITVTIRGGRAHALARHPKRKHRRLYDQRGTMMKALTREYFKHNKVKMLDGSDPVLD
jgi:ankyrin repeat protein